MYIASDVHAHAERQVEMQASTMVPEVELHRERGPVWVFRWEKISPNLSGYFHRTRGNVYRFFIDNSECMPIWIGRLYNGAWVGADAQVRPTVAYIKTGVSTLKICWPEK